MELFLTSRCRCTFPFQQNLTPQDMPLSIVEDAISLLQASEPSNVLLRGNEPALYPELDELLKMLRKKSIGATIATSGLMPEAALNIICANRCSIMFRIYRTDLYPDNTLNEARETLAAMVKAQLPISLVLMADKTDGDYNSFTEWLNICSSPYIMVWSDCTMPFEEKQALQTNLANLLVPLTETGARIQFSCIQQLCCYSDALFGKYTKNGVVYDICTPRLLLLPDGSLAHCGAMTQFSTLPLKNVKTLKAARDYFFDIFRQAQSFKDPALPCTSCLSQHHKLCLGPSLAWKLEQAANLKASLKEIIANPVDPDSPEHLENINKTAIASFLLAQYEDAAECMEELRRHHPENAEIHFWLGCAYWQLGRTSEGTDELRKASRLSKNPLPPLLELHARLVKNGNTIKARLLEEEIKALKKNNG